LPGLAVANDDRRRTKTVR